VQRPTMVTHVLVPHDGSLLSDEALEFTVDHFPDADLTLLRVIDPMTAAYDAPLDSPLPGFWTDWYETAVEQASEDLDEAVASLPVEADAVETRVEAGKPANVILATLEDGDVDHVVMGSHGREGVSRLLLGSVAESVIRRAPVPVTVCR
jgi:nucleotide-binding universal stress UspA family protein